MGHLGIVFQNVYEKPAHQFLWESLLEPIAFIVPSMNMIVLRTGRVDNALWDEVEKQFLEKIFNAIQNE